VEDIKLLQLISRVIKTTPKPPFKEFMVLLFPEMPKIIVVVDSWLDFDHEKRVVNRFHSYTGRYISMEFYDYECVFRRNKKVHILRSKSGGNNPPDLIDTIEHAPKTFKL
jgi:hypothetical protein